MEKINFLELNKCFSLRERLDYLESHCRPDDCEFDEGFYEAIVLFRHFLGY